jgi:hypothetical protein
MGYGLVNEFIDHLRTPLGTASNYIAIANLHSLQITTLSFFPVSCVFTSRSLATASNSGDGSAYCAQVLSSHAPIQNSTLN